MVTTAKQISHDKHGREVLFFDVPEKTGIVSVIGADTDLGANMVKHLSDVWKTVYGFSQEKDFKFSLRPISEHETGKTDYPPHPILSDWLVLCIDPRIGFEKYTSRIRNLCNYLYRKKYRGDILLFSSTEICQPDDNPPIGIVLGAKKDELLMEYATQGITNQLFAARYQLYLPKKEELQSQLDLLLSEEK